MKQDNTNPPPAAAYMRVGNIQQMFKSNTQMAQHLFKELLNDGKEHSYKEICGYVSDQTNGRGVDGNRLTDETIHSAIWYLFRYDSDFRYAQTRKGYYQKNSAESLLGDGKSSLRQFSLRELSELKEKIRLYAAVPGMSEQEQKDVSQVLQNITGAIDQALIQIDDDVFGATRMNADNLKITDELFNDGDRVIAYFDIWLDVDKRFGTQTEGTDAYIDLCVNYYPKDKTLSVYYILHDADGAERDPVSVPDLTAYERDAILTKLRDAGLDECVTEMQAEPDEGAGMTMT
jgi:hypothetical protein